MCDFLKPQEAGYKNQGDYYYFDCFVDLFFLQFKHLSYQILLEVLLLEIYSNTA